MEDFLTTITPGLVFAIMAFAFKLAFDRWLIGRTKDVIVRFENGKVDTVTVDASASDAEVAYAIREGVELERDVGIALKKLSHSMPGLLIQEGGPVDFLVRSSEKTIAIECKASVDRMSEASIGRYLDAIEGVASKLVLISTSAPSPSAASTLNRLIDSGRLSYIVISRSDDVVETLSKTITAEFVSPRRDKRI